MAHSFFKNIFTPALVLDEKILDANIARMAQIAGDKKITLRPHAKTPKSLPIIEPI